ncbi:MAG: hypothetical protein IPK14_15620 [Blastocatellia bacterium]|nr:hypothetical protein [Blastocatellia bacterium]
MSSKAIADSLKAGPPDALKDEDLSSKLTPKRARSAVETTVLAPTNV